MRKTQGTIVAAEQTPLAIEPAELAQRMREKRAAHGLSIRQAAEEAGVSASTFSRVVNSAHVPYFVHMLHLAQWVGVTQVQLSVHDEPSSMQLVTSAVVHSPRESTLESIAVHLHADGDLSPEDVDLLMSVLRVQYSHLKKRSQR